MGTLEERAFEKKRETLIKADDERANLYLRILKKGIIKGDYYSGGKPVKYHFRFDSIFR